MSLSHDDPRFSDAGFDEDAGMYEQDERDEYNADTDPDYGKRDVNAEVAAVMQYGIVGGAR